MLRFDTALKRLCSGYVLYALCCVSAPAAAPSSANAEREAGVRGARPSIFTARPSITKRKALRASSSASYTIHDVGSPPMGTYSSSSPVGFNNSGQIYGIASRKAKSIPTLFRVDQSCLVWTRARFVDLAPSLIVASCTPYAMNSARSATGTFTIVGAFTDIHHYYGTGYNDSDAFSANVGASGSVGFVPYYDHYPATLFGVNAAGVATGFSQSQYDFAQPVVPVFVTSAPQQLTLLQTACVARAKGCLQPVEFIHMRQLNGEPAVACPFGGCTINDAGLALGYDSQTSDYAVAADAPPSTTTELPLSTASAFVVSIDNAGRLVYFTQANDAVHTVTATVYDIASGTSNDVTPLSGTKCSHYFPISMNNSGHVLGFTTGCAPGRNFYWLWDAVDGTKNVSTIIPPSTYTIKPLGINDNMQILVSLQTAAGAIHWGTLDPPSAAPAAGGSQREPRRDVR